MPGGTARRSIWLAAIVLVGASCVTACGEVAPASTRHDERLWRPYAWAPARRPFGLGGWKELAVLDLPWAGSPGPDLGVDRNRSRFLVNVEAGGAVMFKGMRWSIRGDGRGMALESLGQSVRSLSRGAVNRGESVSAVLRCDYHTPFGDVRTLLASLGTAPVSLERFSFALASSDEASWLDARIDADVVKAAAADARSLKVVLVMVGPVDSRDAAPRVKLGERTLTFAAGGPYDAGAANELANAHWRTVLSDLRAAKADGVTAVELGVSAHVPWAHVAMLFGLLLEAGITDLRLDGAAFQLSTPAPLASVAVDGGALHDWSPAFALGLGVAGALAVFALGAWTGRRRLRSA